jgi:hypothetical protein
MRVRPSSENHNPVRAVPYKQLLEVAAEEFRRFHVHVPRTFVIT